MITTFSRGRPPDHVRLFTGPDIRWAFRGQRGEPGSFPPLSAGGLNRFWGVPAFGPKLTPATPVTPVLRTDPWVPLCGRRAAAGGSSPAVEHPRNAPVMLPERSALGERVFLSADVARLAGVSLRQLQWLDERKLVSPPIEDHRRVYTGEQVLEILTVAALRRKGLSLKKIRKVLRLLRRELGQQGRILVAKSNSYLVTDGNSLFVDDQPEGVLDRIADSKHATYLVCLTDLMKRITSEQAPCRYRTKQMQLF